MLNLSHKRLTVWKDSITLVKKIYLLTATYPPEEKFGLVSQMRDAVVSIPLNVSEGASRVSGKEKKRFYEIARSSLVELDTQLIVSQVLAFVTDQDLEEVDELINKIFAQITVMRNKTEVV